MKSNNGTYERAELEIITFQTDDVITTSGEEEYEDKIRP